MTVPSPPFRPRARTDCLDVFELTTVLEEEVGCGYAEGAPRGGCCAPSWAVGEGCVLLHGKELVWDPGWW